MTKVSDFLITTDADTSKYLTNAPYTNSYSSASVSVGVGSYTTRSFSIPLSTSTRLYDIWVNISLDGGTYMKIPNMDRQYSSNQQLISTQVNANNGVATLTLYLVNQSGGAQTFPAFTVNIIRRDYVDSI